MTFDDEPIRVSTDVADKHARYISEIALPNPGEVEKVTNELSDNGARCVDYCFCKRTAIISAESTPLQTQGAVPCSFAARMAANRSCCWHLHVLPQ